jgi:hypothetical protein
LCLWLPPGRCGRPEAARFEPLELGLQLMRGGAAEYEARTGGWHSRLYTYIIIGYI